MGESASVFSNLAATLAEIRKLRGVKGYILCSSTAAVADLTPNAALSQYAVLSHQISNCTRSIAEQFNLADVEGIIIEGTQLKVLCMSIDGNKLSIFMDKTCLHTWIVKRILL